jgi:hypothetical protein
MHSFARVLWPLRCDSNSLTCVSNRCIPRTDLDDQFSGVDFYGNTVNNATVGVMLSGGRSNLIHGNHFMNSVEQDIYFADQGLTWQTKIAWENCTAAMGEGSCLVSELEMFHFKQPPCESRQVSSRRNAFATAGYAHF